MQTKNEYRRRAKQSKFFWRVVFEGIDYKTAEKMDWDEIMEANAYLDIRNEKMRKKTKR